MNDDTKLVRHILNKQYISLPTIFFKKSFIIELNSALLTKKARTLSDFFYMAAGNIGYMLKPDYEEFFTTASEIQKTIITNSGDLLNEDDKKVLNFVSSINKSELKDTLDIIGMLYFITKVTSESEELDDKHENARLAILLWCFQNLYELILDLVDRRLHYYISKNIKFAYDDKNIRDFMNSCKREGNKHASVGKINMALASLTGVKEENKSIFGKNKEIGIREIRNSIAHSNLFYDAESRQISFTGGAYITIDEFKMHYFHLYFFLCRWLELSSNMSLEKYAQNLKTEFTKMLFEMSNKLHDIAASPDHRMRYHRLIIEWRDEIESEARKSGELPFVDRH